MQHQPATVTAASQLGLLSGVTTIESERRQTYRDGGRVKIVNVSRFDPAMLPERVVHAILVVSISSGIVSHVSAEFERIVSILVRRQARRPCERINGMIRAVPDCQRFGSIKTHSPCTCAPAIRASRPCISGLLGNCVKRRKPSFAS